MNGVWHSEQVISRSGIAVSPRERIEDIPSLCSSERWRGVSFNHKVCGAKALFLKHYAESWRPDVNLGLSVLQQITLFKLLIHKECGNISAVQNASVA